MLHSLVLSVTWNCPIKCRYCGVHAGPHRRERMSLGFMTRIIDEAHALGVVKIVVFTGGEPFVLGEDLYSAVAYAAQKGLLTRIVTNAYWATSLDRARRVLARLKEVGLTEINYSCDDFHQEFIPLERIRWANEAARDVGMPALLAVKGIRHSRITPDYLDGFLGLRLARFVRGCENPSNDVLSFGYTVPVGWESENLTDDDLLWPENEDTWKGCCTSVLESIVITPSGKLSICCGIGSDDVPETIVGDTNEKSLVDLLIDANNDLFVNWLALEGPYSIMQYILERDPSIPFRDKYVNTCHLCHDIFARKECRSILQVAAHHQILSLSLKRAWLETHRSEYTRLVAESH